MLPREASKQSSSEREDQRPGEPAGDSRLVRPLQQHRGSGLDTE